MILVTFTKLIDGKTVKLKDAVYARDAEQVPEYMGRDAEWEITDEADLEDIDARVVAEVDKNGFAIVKVRHLISKPFI